VKSKDGGKVEEVVLGTVETKFHSKNEAIGLALKRLGALVERHQVESSAPPAGEFSDAEWEALAILRHEVRPAAQAMRSGEGERESPPQALEIVREVETKRAARAEMAGGAQRKD
jgi:hypothetical protein